MRLLMIGVVACSTVMPTSVTAQKPDTAGLTLGVECLQDVAPKLWHYSGAKIVGGRCKDGMLLGFRMRNGNGDVSWFAFHKFPGNPMGDVLLDNSPGFWTGTTVVTQAEMIAIGEERLKRDPRDPQALQVKKYFDEVARVAEEEARLQRKRVEARATLDSLVKAEKENDARERAAARNAAQKAAAKRVEQERARRARISAYSWPQHFKDAVIARKVGVGMTPEMVKDAWGRPEKINETLTASGSHEQWVYESSYVYFESGRVTAIQTSR